MNLRNVKTGQSASPGIGSEFAERVADEINVEDWVSGQPAFVLVSVIEVLQLEKSPKAEKLKKAIRNYLCPAMTKEQNFKNII